MKKSALRLYFTLNVVFLVMLAFSYPFLAPGSASYVVAQLGLMLVVPASVGAGVLLYRRSG